MVFDDADPEFAAGLAQDEFKQARTICSSTSRVLVNKVKINF